MGVEETESTIRIDEEGDVVGMSMNVSLLPLARRFWQHWSFLQHQLP